MSVWCAPTLRLQPPKSQSGVSDKDPPGARQDRLLHATCISMPSYFLFAFGCCALHSYNNNDLSIQYRLVDCRPGFLKNYTWLWLACAESTLQSIKQSLTHAATYPCWLGIANKPEIVHRNTHDKALAP